MAEDCIFCKIVAGEIPADKLYEDDEVLVFRDIAPQAPVHFLVIPKKHIKGPAAITSEDEQLMGKIMRIGGDIAAQEGVEQYRVVFNNGAQAGQTVFHIHMHILGGRNMQWPPG
ncbi:MAG: histidine triad nucleotide-binding protein [Desulfobulbus propionicus]|nr:MAG: histidine triad nucleotide-binding protein [Desulfobulbus propionicus]